MRASLLLLALAAAACRSSFSGNPEATPRYDYNQILYRLDLDHPALLAAQAR